MSIFDNANSVDEDEFGLTERTHDTQAPILLAVYGISAFILFKVTNLFT